VQRTTWHMICVQACISWISRLHASLLFSNPQPSSTISIYNQSAANDELLVNIYFLPGVQLGTAVYEWAATSSYFVLYDIVLHVG
jgi:hypothetical protein